jgi:hypothetical protein
MTDRTPSIDSALSPDPRDPLLFVRHMAGAAHLFWPTPWRVEESTPEARRLLFGGKPGWPDDDDVALMFDADSPIAELVPVLAAHAWLSVPHREGDPWSVEREAIGILTAHGWRWHEEQGAVRDRDWYGANVGNRPEQLRSHAIRALADAWHDGGSAKAPVWLVDRVRRALRWFFAPADLTPSKVAQAIRNE